MTKATKRAHMRSLLALLSLVLPLLLPAFIALDDLESILPGPPWVAGVCLLLIVLVSALACLYFVFLWHPRCPQCRKVGARFTRDGDDEYLVCGTCNYREKTGYDYRS
jgi:hypothetical protein